MYDSPPKRLQKRLDQEFDKTVGIAGNVLTKTKGETICTESARWKVGENDSGVEHAIYTTMQHLLQRKDLQSSTLDYTYHRFTQLYGDAVLLNTLNPNTNHTSRDKFARQCAARSRDCCEIRMDQENDDEAKSVWKFLTEYWDNSASVAPYPDIVAVGNKTPPVC